VTKHCSRVRQVVSLVLQFSAESAVVSTVVSDCLVAKYRSGCSTKVFCHYTEELVCSF
jgi:hypothetical protein